MDLLPKHAHPSNLWGDELDSVSGFYGPGVVISWCLMAISMLYDANKVFKTEPDDFHYLKYASIIFVSLWALADGVWRALYSDFGPSYAAALYMSDKGFEVATLLYTIHLFPVHRQTTGEASIKPSDEERADQRSQAQSYVLPLPP